MIVCLESIKELAFIQVEEPQRNRDSSLFTLMIEVRQLSYLLV